jgi:hypothetical protein
MPIDASSALLESTQAVIEGEEDVMKAVDVITQLHVAQ